MGSYLLFTPKRKRFKIRGDFIPAVVGECYLCRKQKPVVEHHIQYQPIELTIPLCSQCHGLVHSKEGKETLPALFPKGKRGQQRVTIHPEIKKDNKEMEEWIPFFYDLVKDLLPTPKDHDFYLKLATEMKNHPKLKKRHNFFKKNVFEMARRLEEVFSELNTYNELQINTDAK